MTLTPDTLTGRRTRRKRPAKWPPADLGRTHPGLVVASLVALASGVGITGSLGAPVVPAIAAEHAVPLSTAQWMVTAPFLVGAIAAPVVGRIGAGGRRRPVLLWMLALATLGAAIASIPGGGIELMITGRSIQGLAFATTPLIFAAARESLPEARQRSAIGTISVANVASAGLGYPVMATVVEFSTVSMGFLVSVVLMAAVLLLAAIGVPPSAEGIVRGWDVVGAILLAGGVLALLLLISELREWPLWLGAVTLAVAVLLLAAAILWFRRADQPLVDFRLALERRVLGLHSATFLLGVGCYIFLGVVIVVVQGDPSTGFGQGNPIIVAGLMLVPYAACSMIGNRIAMLLSVRWSGNRVLTIGCLIFAFACVALALWHAEPWQTAIVMAIGGLASGFSFNAIPWLMVEVAPAGELSSALGLNIVVRFVGFSLGSATSIAVLSSVLHETGDGALALWAAMLLGAISSLLAGAVALILMRGCAASAPA